MREREGGNGADGEPHGPHGAITPPRWSQSVGSREPNTQSVGRRKGSRVDDPRSNRELARKVLHQGGRGRDVQACRWIPQAQALRAAAKPTWRGTGKKDMRVGRAPTK